MRRKDREVTDTAGIAAILNLCRTCHVAMFAEEAPYVVPLSYGYELADGKLTLYFHCAKEGRKLELLRRNDRVGFELCCEGEAVTADTPCNYGYCFASVAGSGRAVFIDDPAEKCRALTKLFYRQTGTAAVFGSDRADTVCVFKIVSTDFTGKRRFNPLSR